MLPLSLTGKTHLFFTFFNVSCKKKVGTQAPEVIGYAALPIYPSGRYNVLFLDVFLEFVVALFLTFISLLFVVLLLCWQFLFGCMCSIAFHNHRFTGDGIYNLPIAAQLPDSYLLPFENAKVSANFLLGKL